jgi:hypothetical protein
VNGGILVKFLGMSKMMDATERRRSIPLGAHWTRDSGRGNKKIFMPQVIVRIVEGGTCTHGRERPRCKGISGFLGTEVTRAGHYWSIEQSDEVKVAQPQTCWAIEVQIRYGLLGQP